MSTGVLARRRSDRIPVWILVLGAVLVVLGALVALAAVGGDTLPERSGPPIEEIGVERVVLRPGTIELTVRNTGPDPVTIAQVAVNDSYTDFSTSAGTLGRLEAGTLVVVFPWIEGQPYLVSMLTSTGAVVEHDIPVATQTPEPGRGLLGVMALIGLYVGVLPVVLGMLFLPALRRLGGAWTRALLALTVGLLAFLAVDATLEGLDLAATGAGAFGGQELVVLGAGLAFLALTGVDRLVRRRGSRGGADGASPMRLATLVAVGIGLHNLGEGLAIGSAYAAGALALGAFLIVGFAAHNTTEGLAIVAPLTRARPSVPRLLALGLVAGAPATVGAVVGAGVDNAELTAFLLGVGVGAICQVVVQVWPGLRGPSGRTLDGPVVGGLAAGVLAMFLTGLVVAV